MAQKKKKKKKMTECNSCNSGNSSARPANQSQQANPSKNGMPCPDAVSTGDSSPDKSSFFLPSNASSSARNTSPKDQPTQPADGGPPVRSQQPIVVVIPRPDQQQHPHVNVACRQAGVICQFCGKSFKNLQGHSCPQKRAALQRPSVVDPDTSISVKNWPFQSLADIRYKDIFTSPLTIGDVPPDCVAQFSAVVGEVARHILGGEKEAWKAFFLLPRMVFALPRGGKEGRKLARSYLELFSTGEWNALLQRQAHHVGDFKGTVDRNKRAISLARAGYFSGATRALVDNKMADPSQDDVYDQLLKLHPAAERLREDPPQRPFCALSEDIFVQTVSSAPPRRAPDASG